MKKIAFLLSISLIIFSCTKDESDLSLEKGRGDGLYSLSEGDGSFGGGGTSDPGGGQGGGEQIEPGQITAGEWNDLDNWDFWNDLMNGQEFSEMKDYWEFNLNTRISIRLINSSAVPVINVKVELLNKENDVIWVSKTDNFGAAELWPYLKNTSTVNINDLKIRVGTEVFGNIQAYEVGVNELILDGNPSQPETKRTDICFMVDATGSMSDELEYLKIELIDVIGQVKTENPNAELNMGSVFYRDEGDEYITKKSDFSTETNKTIDFIRDQSANGGGDFPEAVHSAMRVSLNDLQWSSNATSRLLFMVLDAPPHYENQVVDEIHSLTVKAAGMGIKLIPITASGIDKQTEFLMRYLSIATNGSYVFITNHSGIGGEHLEPTIGEYDVEMLNDLMVRLINKYLE